MFYIRYVGALLYDGIILVALCFFFTASCLLCRNGKAIPPASLWYQIAIFFLAFAYYFISHLRAGQTIGMRAWHLRLVSLEAHLGKKQILTRFFLTIPACIYGLLRIKSPGHVLKNWSASFITDTKSFY
jgi:uncharacterized RDD family membrane protein YckC